MIDKTFTEMMEKPRHLETWADKVLTFLAHRNGAWSTWGPSFYMPSLIS